MPGAGIRVAAMALVLLGGLALAGSPVQAGSELGQSRRAVEAARSDPAVRALAAVELDDAEIALRWTERAVARKAPHDEVAHLAYVTRQRAALARARAAQRRAERALEALRRER